MEVLSFDLRRRVMEAFHPSIHRLRRETGDIVRRLSGRARPRNIAQTQLQMPKPRL